jgi:hypothetical protein
MSANLRAKGAKFAPFKKGMSFVSEYFLASFSLSFSFCGALLSPHAGTLPLSF